jgi:hypothetical protein
MEVEESVLDDDRKGFQLAEIRREYRELEEGREECPKIEGGSTQEGCPT